MPRSMDSILSDEPSVHTLPDAHESESRAADEQPTADAAPSKVETTKPEATKSDAKPAKEAEQHDDGEEQEHVPDSLDGLKRALAAARGDKRKARKQWQETERKLAELQGRLSVLQQQPRAPQPEQPKPQGVDLTEEDFFGKGPAAVKAFVDQRLQQMQRDAEQKFLSRSEKAAQRRHADYGEAFVSFQELVQSQPGLVAQMLADDDPGEFAYQTGKTYRDLQGVSTLDELKAKLEAEIRAKIEAERSQSVTPQPAKQHSPIPRSLAGARGNGAGVTQAWTGPRSLDDILG